MERNAKVDKRSPDSLNIHIDSNANGKSYDAAIYRHLESAAFYQFEHFLGSLPGAVKADSTFYAVILWINGSTKKCYILELHENYLYGKQMLFS